MARHRRDAGAEEVLHRVQVGGFEQLRHRAWEAPELPIHLELLTDQRRIGAHAWSAGVVVVVARHLRHVQVHVVNCQPGNLSRTRGEGLAELSEVIGRDRDPEHRADAVDGAQALERLDLPAEPALDAANLVVRLLVAVKADRHDGPRRPAPGDARDAARDAIGQETVGREMEEREAPPTGHDGIEHLVDILAQKDFASRQVDPRDVGVLTNEGADFIGREFVGGLSLPDVAGLAAILAPVGQAPVHLQRHGRPPDGGVKNPHPRMSGARELLNQSTVHGHCRSAQEAAG